MKTDIPALMRARRLDAIVVRGNTDTSTDLAYLVGGVKLENALYLQKADGPPLLVASPIEREVAASTGYRLRLWSDYDLIEYTKRHHNDRFRASVAILSDLLRDEGVRGRVGFYGLADQGYSYIFLQALAAANPHIEIVGEPYPNLFHVARQTKDAQELAAMRRVGERTGRLLDSVFDFLAGQRAHDGVLVHADGRPVTVGDVKTHIRLEMARLGLAEAHENIFAPGREGAVPHNTGNHDRPLRLGETIVFDVFPYDPATGYFHDVTRTFFLGYAPDPLAERWQQVKAVFDRVLAELRVGERCARYQELVCDAFESLGYPTLRQDPKTQRGYVHSLGHGVGLDIHEPPALNLMPDNDAVFAPGHVFSVEPGLYEPDAPPDGGPGGWAIRIEDTVAFDQDGRLVNLTAYPYPMVIPVRGISG